VFHAIWCTSGAQLEGPADDDLLVDDTTRRLMRIAPRSRQAFLLTALEGFTPSEASQILDADFAEVEQLISEAQAEIDAELATDVLIIEDEPGIDAVKDILQRYDVPVIFITAFPERLLTGERPEPTFLITKPFQPETVKAAIGQALFFHPRKASKQAA
jgi:CheY-like chemotaxis protein